jgi:superfamily II DNA or RNA helicase
MTLTNSEIAEFFADTHIRIADNPALREPQQQGHAAAVAHFAGGGGRAMEQIPVGCGKSGLLTLLPFGVARGRALVIAPNLTIRDQLYAAFDISNPDCFYRRSAALTDLHHGPFVATLDADANLGDLDDAHVAVTNIQQLGAGGGRWLGSLAPDFFDLILVDEGHHNAAPTWQNVFERFPDAKVLSLTATPFRGDDQPVEGEQIYSYPIAEAMRRGYITNIQASNVAPSELTFSYRGDERTHTLEEVLRLKDRDWFSRGVALSEACNISIVDASIEWLKHLRQVGNVGHQIVAVACSVDHARAIRRLYEERGWTAHEIHSQMPSDQQTRVLRDLRDGTLDVIVQVQMLGEGFDHPPLSVAAVFRPFRSLSPYIQFVGRVMRVNIQHTPGHVDNRGIVVSHVGLNIDRHWDDFKRIDLEDQRLIQSWLAGEAQPPPSQPGDGERRPLTPDMVVRDELTLDRFLGDTFLEIDEQDLPDRVLEVLRAQGIDPAAAGLDRDILDALRATRTPAGPTAPVSQPVQPQAHRQALKARLAERSRVLAARVCTAAGLSPAGKKLAARGGTGAANDLQAVIILVNRAVNDYLGRPKGTRRELTTRELTRALDALEEIGDQVQADVTEAVG